MDNRKFLLIMWILAFPFLIFDIIFDYKTYFSVGYVFGMMIITYWVKQDIKREEK